MTATAVDELERTVWVARHPKGRRARYRLADLGRPHWAKPSGGPLTRVQRYWIHAFVVCDEMLTGGLDHSCAVGSGPHRIKVCVIAADTDRTVMELLHAQVGPKP